MFAALDIVKTSFSSVLAYRKHSVVIRLYLSRKAGNNH